MSHSLSASMFRARFRDTALTVSMLSAGAKPEYISDWYQHTVSLVQQLRANLRADGAPEALVEKISYAQCALLDEMALRYLSEEQRATWEQEPLQVRFFKSYNAGEVLIAQMREQLLETTPVLALSDCYAMVLGLGFRGLSTESEQQALLAQFSAAVTASREPGPESFDGKVWVIQNGTRWRRRSYLASPLLWALLAILLTGLLYWSLDTQLTSAISSLSKPN